MSREELANLPGRPEEQGWLRERMEVLTVREGIALDAALQRGAPADARDAVNLLANLDEYEVVGGIQSYEDLGLYDLEENDAKLLALRDYIDLDKLGRRYEEQHPGLFVGGCYVIFPERELLQQYDGVTLPGPEYSWSLRLKLGSPAVPEGVWLALPDYNDIMDVRPGEIRLALDALGAQVVQDCTLLEARCSLPGVTGLEASYELNDAWHALAEGFWQPQAVGYQAVGYAAGIAWEPFYRWSIFKNPLLHGYVGQTRYRTYVDKRGNDLPGGSFGEVETAAYVQAAADAGNFNLKAAWQKVIEYSSKPPANVTFSWANIPFMTAVVQGFVKEAAAVRISYRTEFVTPYASLARYRYNELSDTAAAVSAGLHLHLGEMSLSGGVEVFEPRREANRKTYFSMSAEVEF